MVEDILKRNIADYAVNAFHHAQDKALASSGKRLKTWHVSDFVSPCLRKAYYTRLYPDYEMDDQKRAVLYFGTIVHEHSQLSGFHEMTMCYDLEKDMAFTPQHVGTMEEEQKRNMITGTLDDLIKVGDQYTIVDKKTYNGGYGFKKTTPDESYKFQLEIYRVLLEASFGIDASVGCLLYLDKSKDLKETPIVFDLESIANTKSKMIDIMKILQGVDVPAGNVCWLCNGNNRNNKIYCQYEEECQREGNRIIEKAMIKKAK